MRFMVLVKGDEKSEAGVLPSEQLLTQMGTYNEELERAGAMLGGAGLHPSSKGARVRFSRGQTSVINGPFGRPQELLAGFWLLEAESMDQVIEWVKRMPNPEDDEGEVEIRQVFEMDDFGPELSPELREQDERLRAQAEEGLRPT
jgi:hypothetical protein